MPSFSHEAPTFVDPDDYGVVPSDSCRRLETGRSSRLLNVVVHLTESLCRHQHPLRQSRRTLAGSLRAKPRLGIDGWTFSDVTLFAKLAFVSQSSFVCVWVCLNS